MSLPLGGRLSYTPPVARCAAAGEESESLSGSPKYVLNVLRTSIFKQNYMFGSGCTAVLFVAELKKEISK